eukprot:scaffold196_cov113-Cylindrotheca_fusiformis.AAC.2
MEGSSSNLTPADGENKKPDNNKSTLLTDLSLPDPSEGFEDDVVFEDGNSSEMELPPSSSRDDEEHEDGDATRNVSEDANVIPRDEIDIDPEEQQKETSLEAAPTGTENNEDGDKTRNSEGAHVPPPPEMDDLEGQNEEVAESEPAPKAATIGTENEDGDKTRNGSEGAHVPTPPEVDDLEEQKEEEVAESEPTPETAAIGTENEDGEKTRSGSEGVDLPTKPEIDDPEEQKEEEVPETEPSPEAALGMENEDGNVSRNDSDGVLGPTKPEIDDPEEQKEEVAETEPSPEAAPGMEMADLGATVSENASDSSNRTDAKQKKGRESAMSSSAVPTGTASEEEATTTNNTKAILFFGICVFIIVVLQCVIVGLVVTRDNDSNDDSDIAPQQSKQPVSSPPSESTILSTAPTTSSTTSPTNTGFQPLASDPAATNVTVACSCDNYFGEYALPELGNNLFWSNSDRFSNITVNSNGFLDLGCFDSAFCATIDVVAVDVDSSIEGAEYGNVYVLWDQKDRRVTATGDQRQQRPPRTAPTLIVSWEHDDALDGSTASSPYRINAQVRITSEEITFCYGEGNVTGRLFQAGVRNNINGVFEPLAMRVFDSSGRSYIFPENSCESILMKDLTNGGFVPSFFPSLLPSSSIEESTSQTPTNDSWQPSMSPTNGPTMTPTNGPTMTPTNGPTIAPTNGPTMTPTNDPTMTPTNGPTMAPTNDPSMPPSNYPSVGPSCNSLQPTSDIPGRYYGFTSIARNPQATPLTFVSSCSSNCTEPTEFESFPYLWKGSYEIFQIDVNSNGSLELVGNCVNDLGEKTRACAIINVASANLDPSMSTSGTTIWAMETSGSYIYSFEQVPFSEDGTEEPPSQQPFITAEVHLYSDGRVDLCWGDMFREGSSNRTFVSNILDETAGISYPATGPEFNNIGESNTGRFPYSFCQMLLGTCFLGDITVCISLR